MNFLLKSIPIIFVSFILAGCPWDSDGGSDPADTGSSNWDQMKWDQDNWN